MLWLVAILVLLVLIAGAVAVAIWVNARRLSRTSRRLAQDPLEPVQPSPVAAFAHGIHLRTTLFGDELDACLPGFRPGIAGELSVTEHDLVLRGESGAVLLHVPLARVVEPALVRSFEGLSSEEVGGILRVAWERGGERLATVFAVEGGRVDAERLRRELHLRSGRLPLPTMPAGFPGAPGPES